MMKDNFKSSTVKEFEISDLGLMQYFLGMGVYQSKDEIFLCQTKYTKDMLKNFDMTNCKLASTPLSQGVVLCRDDGVEKVDGIAYRSVIVSLMFLNHSRPNITYFVSLVSRYMEKPYQLHMKVTKIIMRYVILIGEIVWMTKNILLVIVSLLVWV